jgi:site-specific recombinase XerC
MRGSIKQRYRGSWSLIIDLGYQTDPMNGLCGLRWADVELDTGQPLQANNLGERSLDRLAKMAVVRRIKFHGLRHTCATLLLQAGEPVHVVAERLGHSDVNITLNTYAHVPPDMQRSAADRLGTLLHG